MRAPIDRAGRIVVPKPLRDALALRSGMELEAVDGGLEISIPSAQIRLEDGPRGPRFVSDGPMAPLTVEAIGDVLEAVRERRL